jgi:DNA-binding CsgD family transcriptional regulator
MSNTDDRAAFLRAGAQHKEATAALSIEAREGRLAPEAVDAVLGAAAFARPNGEAASPALTPGEVEVLILLARGGTTKQIARALGITPRTTGTYIERIYAKTGSVSRSTATLFALQQGLLDTFEPADP